MAVGIKVVKALSLNPVNDLESELKKGGKDGSKKTAKVQAGTGIVGFVIKQGSKEHILDKDEACKFIFIETAKAVLKGKEITNENIAALSEKEQAMIGVIDNAKVGKRGTKAFLGGLPGASFYKLGIVECIFKTKKVKKTVKGEEVEVLEATNEVVKPEYERFKKLKPEKPAKDTDPDAGKKNTPKTVLNLAKLYV
jgi:hypothetical protein